jgi:predicted nucleic acid-binding protein
VVKFVEHILKNANVEVVPQSTLLFKKAFDRYRDRDDKDWGLTDCSSFVIMEEMELTEVLAKDHHFAQAGFITLLGSK